MIHAILRITAGCILATTLAACGSSPPSNFYLLTPKSDITGSGEQPSLGLGPVTIPEFLDRSALVYNSGDNQLHIAGTDLWAEPLDKGIARVVGLNLSRLLDTQNIAYFPWDIRRAPGYGVRIGVLDLDAGEGSARLTADWVLYQPRDGTVLSRHISQFSSKLPGPGTVVGQLPPAYSDLLYQLSETIAAAIRERRHQDATAGQ